MGGRALLVRRPQRRGPDGEGLMWWAVDTVRGTRVRGTWRTADDLLAAARSLGAALTASDEDADPMLLVCTQGTRDACCAVRGRPVVARLAKEWPEETWECTHLGGHRFSGTLLALPAGACLGYLDPDTAVDTVRDLLRGRVPATHLRGVTRWEPAVQAALAAALDAFGPAELDDAVPGGRSRPGGRRRRSRSSAGARCRRGSSSRSSRRPCPTRRSAVAAGPSRTGPGGRRCVPPPPPDRPAGTVRDRSDPSGPGGGARGHGGDATSPAERIQRCPTTCTTRSSSADGPVTRPCRTSSTTSSAAARVARTTRSRADARGHARRTRPAADAGAAGSTRSPPRRRSVTRTSCRRYTERAEDVPAAKDRHTGYSLE